jgi:hypothetical protein
MHVIDTTGQAKITRVGGPPYRQIIQYFKDDCTFTLLDGTFYVFAAGILIRDGDIVIASWMDAHPGWRQITWSKGATLNIEVLSGTYIDNSNDPQTNCAVSNVSSLMILNNVTAVAYDGAQYASAIKGVPNNDNAIFNNLYGLRLHYVAMPTCNTTLPPAGVPPAVAPYIKDQMSGSWMKWASRGKYPAGATTGIRLAGNPVTSFDYPISRAAQQGLASLATQPATASPTQWYGPDAFTSQVVLLNGGQPGVSVAPINGAPMAPWTQSGFFAVANGILFSAAPVSAVSNLTPGSRIFIAFQIIDVSPIPCNCLWLRIAWGTAASGLIIALPTPFVTSKGWGSLVYVLSIASNLSGTTLPNASQLTLMVDGNYAFLMNGSTQYLFNYVVAPTTATNYNFDTPAAWCTGPLAVGNLRRLTNDGASLTGISSGLFTQPPIQ